MISHCSSEKHLAGCTETKTEIKYQLEKEEVQPTWAVLGFAVLLQWGDCRCKARSEHSGGQQYLSCSRGQWWSMFTDGSLQADESDESEVEGRGGRRGMKSQWWQGSCHCCDHFPLASTHEWPSDERIDHSMKLDLKWHLWLLRVLLCTWGCKCVNVWMCGMFMNK